MLIWGGRVSDKITESSGLLNYLEAGDVIIADCGFTIDDYCRLTMSEVYIPPFTKGKAQLTKKEVDWSRELSIVRIHVERVIRTVKQKFTILEGTLPLSLVGCGSDKFESGDAPVEKLVTVCCALFDRPPNCSPRLDSSCLIFEVCVKLHGKSHTEALAAHLKVHYKNTKFLVF